MDIVSVVETNWSNPDVERVGVIPTGVINGKRVFGLVFSKSYKLVTVGGAYESEKDYDLFDTLNREIREETHNLSTILKITNGVSIPLLSTICCICPVSEVKYINANTDETTVFVWVNEDNFKLLPTNLTKVSQEIKHLAENYEIMENAVNLITDSERDIPFPDAMRKRYIANPIIENGTYEEALRMASTTQGKYRCFIAGKDLYCVMFSNGSFFYLNYMETLEVMKICKAKDAIFVVPRNFKKLVDPEGQLADAKYFFMDVSTTKILDACRQMMVAEKRQFDATKKKSIILSRAVLNTITNSSLIAPNSSSDKKFVPYITRSGEHGLSQKNSSSSASSGRYSSSSSSASSGRYSSSGRPSEYSGSSSSSSKQSKYYPVKSTNRTSSTNPKDDYEKKSQIPW